MKVLKMSLETHKAEIQSAVRVNRKLRAMQDGISPSKHPRNKLTQIYKTTRTAIFNNFENLPELRNILFLFSSTVSTIVRPLMETSEDIGRIAGLTSLARRKIATSGLSQIANPSIITPAIVAVKQIADSQVAQTIAVATIGGDVSTVIGNGVNSVGFFSQGVLNKQINGFLTAVTSLSQLALWEQFIAEQIADDVYYKQAVAAIDQNTTECCLIVHGQFQPIDSMFELIGSPRFADLIENPPFHWNCRTATALVHASERFDSLTQEMIDAAASELEARGDDDYRVEIHPAFALSGR